MRKAGWIYILHFETKLSHAQHYVGSSAKIAARLAAHRAGRAARLTEVLIGVGIDWTVATVLQCDAADRRGIERWLKDQKKTRLFCPLCSARPRRPAGCIAVPTEAFR